jgi:uncharacterized protein YukE
MSNCEPLVGDTSGMRELAGALRRSASSISACDSAAYPKASSLSFVGPAATRLQDAVGAWHRDLTSTVNLLGDAADLLVRVAAAIDDERARLARLEHR